MYYMNNSLYFITKILIIFVIIFLFWFFKTYKRRKNNRILKKQVLSDSNSDYSGIAKNIISGITNAKILYKKLITQIHPDKFQDHRNKKAHELASKITNAKRNYNELVKLEKEVQEFLK